MENNVSFEEALKLNNYEKLFITIEAVEASVEHMLVAKGLVVKDIKLREHITLPTGGIRENDSSSDRLNNFGNFHNLPFHIFKSNTKGTFTEDSDSNDLSFYNFVLNTVNPKDLIENGFDISKLAISKLKKEFTLTKVQGIIHIKQ